jgi:hypothetical protein
MITALSTVIIIGGIFTYLVFGYVLCTFLHLHKIIDLGINRRTDDPDEFIMIIATLFYPAVIFGFMVYKTGNFIVNLFIKE